MTDMILIVSLITIAANIVVAVLQSYIAFKRWKAEEALVKVEKEKFKLYTELQKLKKVVARLKRE